MELATIKLKIFFEVVFEVVFIGKIPNSASRSHA
jgi:hypothetical protein